MLLIRRQRKTRGSSKSAQPRYTTGTQNKGTAQSCAFHRHPCAESGGRSLLPVTERCPEVLVTNKVDMANYVVTLDHEGGKGLIRKDNKVAVLRKNGDAILSKSTRELGSGVKDACSAILSDAKR